MLDIDAAVVVVVDLQRYPLGVTLIYIQPVTLWRSNLVEGRECRISDEDLVEVAVEGNLGLGLDPGAHHSLGAPAEVEDLALDSLGLEGLHSPVVLLAA